MIVYRYTKQLDVTLISLDMLKGILIVMEIRHYVAFSVIHLINNQHVFPNIYIFYLQYF